MIFRHFLSLTFLICLSPLQSTLVQNPSHSCFQESVTFTCTHSFRLEPDYFVNIINTVLHRPAIASSRLMAPSPSTDAVTGFMSQNLTLVQLSSSEATAIILCISVLWSNLSNATTSIQVQSDSAISLATVPPAISSIAIRVLTESSIALAIQHSDVVYRKDVLQYSIAVHPIGSAAVSRDISYNSLPMEMFNVGNVLDSCYTVSVNSSNCMGRGQDFSTHFILPKVTNGSLTRQSQSEFCWKPPGFTQTCPGPYRVDVLRDNVFTFSLVNNNMILRNLTFETSSTEYCFSIPQEYLDSENLFIRIYINGVVAVAMDVLIPLDDVFPTVSSTLTIITIVVPSVLGLLLLIALATLFIIFLCFLVRRRKRATY